MDRVRCGDGTTACADGRRPNVYKICGVLDAGRSQGVGETCQSNT